MAKAVGDRVFHLVDYLLITDGSALPANPGVNPSLTITALAEHTIAHVPATHTHEREQPSRK